MHLLDLGYDVRQGGLAGRYLQAKSRWLRRHGGWRHSVLDRAEAGRLTRDALDWLAPDLIEADPRCALRWSTLGVGQQFGVPVITSCRYFPTAALGEAGAAAQKAVQRRLRRFYRQFDRVLVPSEWLRWQLEDAGVDHLVTLPVGYDAEVYRPRPRDPSWRAELGLAEDDRVLLYLGDFRADRRLHLLASAVRRLGNSYRLVAFGAGPAAPEGRQVIVRPPLRDPAERVRAFCGADVCVHAGAHDAYSVTLLEAMACGLPLVVKPVGGLVPLASEHHGAVVRRPSGRSFAEAVDSVFARGVVPLGRAAATAARVYGWDALLPRFERHYYALLNAGPQRSQAYRTAEAFALA